MIDSSDALAELLTLTLTVDQWGDRTYRNSSGELHRQYGPAIEHSSGDKEWFLDGQRHRTTGPAIEHSNGTRRWYQNDQLHRIDGPAMEYASGTKEWWLNGQLLSEKEFHDRLK